TSSRGGWDRSSGYAAGGDDMARYKPNHRNFARLLMDQPAHKAARSRARLAKRILEENAPVDTGAYKESIRIEPIVAERKGRAERRRGFLVVADVPYAAAVESGNKNVMDPARPLTKTLAMLPAFAHLPQGK